MPRSTSHSVLSVVVWPFVEALRKLDASTAERAALESLPQAALAALQDGAGGRVSHEHAEALLEWAIKVTGREDLGVLAAEAVEPGHFELVELASRAQRTVGEGLATLASLLPILHDGLVLQVSRAPSTSRLRITLTDGLTLGPAGYDFIVITLLIAARRQTRLAELVPSRIRLPHPKPAHAPPLARVLPCPIEFDADALEVQFETELLDLPLARADASLGHLLRETARGLITQEAAPSELALAVRKRVRESLKEGVDAKTLARQLHMSERTLRRKLDAEGIGLRSLTDELRHELALEKLADPALSTEAIAAELGFTTAQAFHRAFRRWTGGTVQAFRARA